VSVDISCFWISENREQRRHWLSQLR